MDGLTRAYPLLLPRTPHKDTPPPSLTQRPPPPPPPHVYDSRPSSLPMKRMSGAVRKPLSVALRVALRNARKQVAGRQVQGGIQEARQLVCGSPFPWPCIVRSRRGSGLQAAAGCSKCGAAGERKPRPLPMALHACLHGPVPFRRLWVYGLHDMGAVLPTR